MEGGWKKMLFFGTVCILVEVTHHKQGSPDTYEYVFTADLKMSWVEARSYCRKNYDDLATISNEEDNSAINSMNENGSFWIGLYDDVNSWEWSLDKGVLGDYRQWQEGQPDNKGGDERCVSMMADGFWKDNNCTSVKLPFVCFKDKGYQLITTLLNWFNARRYCKEHYTNLVSVGSRSENQDLQRLAEDKHHVPEFWIGLNRDSWKWSNGNPSSFRLWRKIQPSNTNNSQLCAAMQQGYWDGWPCNTKRNVLCQQVAETEPATISPAVLRRSTVKMNLMTNSDLEDPTIRRQILQQLVAALNLKSVTDVKLIWKTLRRDARGQRIK